MRIWGWGGLGDWELGTGKEDWGGEGGFGTCED